MSVNEPKTGFDKIAHPAKRKAEMIEAALYIKEYLEHKGRFPRATEPVYAKLMYYQRLWNQNTPVPIEVKELLDFADTLPKPRQLEHMRRLAEYRKFIAENHRLPSSTRIPEASLAKWADKVKRRGALRNTDVRDSLLALIADRKEQTRDH